MQAIIPEESYLSLWGSFIFLLWGRDWNTQEVELTLQPSGGNHSKKKNDFFSLMVGVRGKHVFITKSSQDGDAATGGLWSAGRLGDWTVLCKVLLYREAVRERSDS